MANPSNAIGTNGAFGGRTSVNAFNDVLATFKGRGILSGWACEPSSGLTVALGGQSGVRDVALAEDNAGNKTTVNNISGAPVEITLSAAPATNQRKDVIVAYIENPPQGTSTDIDNPGAVNLLVVSSVVAATPATPTDADIRSAITADGASGSSAYYVILATVTVVAGVTDITADYIIAGATTGIGADNIDSTAFGFVEYTKSTGISGGTNPIVWDTLSSAHNNDFCTYANGKFQILKTGRYSLSMLLGRNQNAGANGQLNAAICKTGATYRPLVLHDSVLNGDSPVCQTSAVAWLEAGDEIYAQTYTPNVGNCDLSSIRIAPV